MSSTVEALVPCISGPVDRGCKRRPAAFPIFTLPSTPMYIKRNYGFFMTFF